MVGWIKLDYDSFKCELKNSTLFQQQDSFHLRIVCSMNMYLFEHMVIQFYAGFSSIIGNNINVISSQNVVTFVPET